MMNSIINEMLINIEKRFISFFDKYLISIGCDVLRRQELRSKIIASVKSPPGNIIISGSFVTNNILDKHRKHIEIPFFIVTSMSDASYCKIILSGRVGGIAGSRGVEKNITQIVEGAFNMKVL